MTFTCVELKARRLRSGTGFLAAIALAGTFPGQVAGQSAGFQPGQLVVLRVGDGGSEGGASDLRSRQTPVFIDQFDPSAASQSRPSFSVALPCKGTNALWMNGNAGTEGGLARSADHCLLTLTGYCGDILSSPGTPSRLPYERGICVVEPSGATRLAYRGNKWYGLYGDKTNPRGVVSDGTNNFWGCGNEFGTLFFNAGPGIVRLRGVPSTRQIKFINHSLYASITGSDGSDAFPGGLYDFADADGAPAPMPAASTATMKLAVPAAAPFLHIAGFDIGPQGDVAYMADAVNGVVKYIKSGGQWQVACQFYIPGFGGAGTGILTNSASTTVRAGCFGLAADFLGPHPVLFATTTEWSGYGGINVNSNRLIRLDDTNAATGGVCVTNFGRTLAFAPATNICFRAVDFAPEPR